MGRAAEQTFNNYKMEMAKIESDALGPQSDEEKQALAVAWGFLERTLELYQAAETSLHDSQGRVKYSLKEMEAEMKDFKGEPDQEQRAIQAIKTVKEFKVQQADKIDALREQIGRVTAALAAPRSIYIDWAEENTASQDQESQDKEKQDDNQTQAKKSKSKKGKKAA